MGQHIFFFILIVFFMNNKEKRLREMYEREHESLDLLIFSSITNFIKPYRYPVHMLTVGRLGFMKRTVVGNGSDVGIATFFLYKEWNGATFSSSFISWVYSSYPVRRLTFN